MAERTRPAGEKANALWNALSLCGYWPDGDVPALVAMAREAIAKEQDKARHYRVCADNHDNYVRSLKAALAKAGEGEVGDG